MVKKVVVLAILASLALSQPFCMAKEGDLNYLIQDRKTVKVFLKDFVNESGQPQILPEDFKKEVEKTFENRKSGSFKIVTKAEDSTVQIACIIKKYQYLEKDPVTFSPSAPGLLLDAATSENYVTMDAEFDVIKTKTGKSIWKGNVTTFIKHTMAPEQSIPMIYEKLARVFIWKSFGKAK